MSSSPTDTLIDITMPQMGVSVAEGTVVRWSVAIGDAVEADQTICEITTDKIDTEVPAPAAGLLAEILVDVDTTVEVGTVLGRISASSRADQRGASPTETSPPAVPAPAEPLAASGAGTPNGNGNGRAHRLSPVVARIAAENKLDLHGITGTGRGGRIRKQDVLALLDSRSATPEPPMHIESPYRPDPAVPTAPGARAPGAAAGPGGVAASPPAPQTLSRMRRQIGAHMKRSLDTAATCTTWIEVDFSEVEAVRERLGVTALPVVARAVVQTLGEFPALNAWLEGDAYTVHAGVGLGIAVSLGEDGLIVPVIASAEQLSVEGLAARIRDLAERARARQLSNDDIAGGTFTITNPGQFGSVMATPVINQPQVAILDLEAVVKRAVVLTDERGNDSIAIRPICILGLSWDHRALDGALAAQFLASLKRRLETTRGE